MKLYYNKCELDLTVTTSTVKVMFSFFISPRYQNE